MTDIRKRFDHATDLRTFAAEVERLELAGRRDPESPVLAKVALAQRMRRQADAVMRAADAVERGRITADTLFRPTGRVVKVDVRRARVRPTGTIKVAA